MRIRSGDRNYTTYGRLYVLENGKLKKSYEVCAGPPPNKGYADRGGHTAGVTPAGIYTLAAPEHHVTPNWPMSSIPWGAAIRKGADGEVEYKVGAKWHKATGRNGVVFKALVLFEQRTRADNAKANKTKPAPLTEEDKNTINEQARNAFDEDPDKPTGRLVLVWKRNDFGVWAFNLTKHGQRTAYYFHTTPDDEEATEQKRPFELAQSHGCVHLRPADRDELMMLGYLKEGVIVEVKEYGTRGPPP